MTSIEPTDQGTPFAVVDAIPPRTRLSNDTKAHRIAQQLINVPGHQYAVVETLAGSERPTTALVSDLRALGVEASSRTRREGAEFVLRVYARGTGPTPVDETVVI